MALIQYFHNTYKNTISSTVVELDLSTQPSGPYQLSSGQLTPAIVNTSGQMIIELSFTPTASLSTQSVSDFYLLSADTPDGNGYLSIRFVSADGTFRLSVNGTDRVTVSPYPTRGNTYPIWTANQPCKVIAWYDGNNGNCGMRFVVNGCTFMDQTVVVATPTGLKNPTNIWLGSNRGASGLTSIQFTRLISYAFLSDPVPKTVATSNGYSSYSNATGRIVILGDSNSASLYYLSQYRVSSATKILQSSEIKNNNSIVNLAIPGGTFVNQLECWQKSNYRGSGNVIAVAFMLGVNDAGAGNTTSTILSNATALVNDIKANCKNAKIFALTYAPALGYLGSTNWGYLSGYNNSINTIGADVIISGHTVALDSNPSSPTGNLANSYDLGDHLHINDPAETIIGSYIRTAFLNNNIIS